MSLFQGGGRTERLGREWKKVHVEGPSGEELDEVVRVGFPHLAPVATRLLALFASIQEAEAGVKGTSRRRFTLRYPMGRSSPSPKSQSASPNHKLSLLLRRDFLKFCRRIPPRLNLTESEAGVLMFQEAADIFLASIQNYREEPTRTRRDSDSLMLTLMPLFLIRGSL
jgi:hypothetical protein